MLLHLKIYREPKYPLYPLTCKILTLHHYNLNVLRTKVPTLPTDMQNFNLTHIMSVLRTKVPTVPTEMQNVNLSHIHYEFMEFMDFYKAKRVGDWILFPPTISQD